MKKILIIAFLLVSTAGVAHAATDGFTALAPIPGLTGPGITSVVNSASLATFFNNFYKYLIGMAAILAVIEIIWGGLEISTKDSISKKSDGKERITQAIFGLVLVLSPVLVFSIINPSILNLSLDLPAIAPGAPAPTPDTLNNSLNNPASYGTPTGTLSTCANNDCTAASTACSGLATTGLTADPVVVCVQNGNVLLNQQISADAASVCPSSTQKQVECLTVAGGGG